MDEAYFWGKLEFRLCREFAGLPERRYQYFWCDGFIPSEYVLDGPSPRITGKCWICNGPKQDEWNFALLLPGPVGSGEEIDWAALHRRKTSPAGLSFDESGVTSRSSQRSRRRTWPDQRLKLTGAAILVFRASTSLKAAPAA